MDAQEIDSTLDELENRLDRLRALYEQYFLGIEKIEPAVARKDVDRRFWVLRRTNIRNTARRFRLQTLVQRYNTFQQYWTRICREIENGTYARHLLKAQKNLGAEPKTWAAKKRLGLLRRGGVLVSNGAPAEIAAASGAEAILDRDGPSEDVSPLPPATPGSAEKPLPKAIVQRAPTVTLTLDDLGPLDLDFDDEPAPLPRRPPSATPARPALPSPKERPPLPPRAAPPNPVAPRAAAPPARATPPNPMARGLATAPARPMAPGPVAPPAARPGAAGPMAPNPAAAPARPAAANPIAPGPAAMPSQALSDERVRKLHAELVETKRKLNQSNTVSVDSLARSLRETEQKLRAQHAGRNVDFQIVVKDGKPVVKPVIRK